MIVDGMHVEPRSATSDSDKVVTSSLLITQPRKNTIIELCMARWVTYRADISSRANLAITAVRIVNPDGTTDLDEFDVDSGPNVIVRENVTSVVVTAQVSNAHVRGLVNLFFWPVVVPAEERA
ncbi:hypothetical protein C1701_24345 [Actinoalloteichus sp. AHMU CJ021]|uniref:hypothetical protein n=1 Tax=Actinoalloteichus TaxID=65496 RepID=UPI0004AA4646|nr:hypothetical protein [Actinoalloteichus caeruleus]AUS80950.1 hypothetical protein C1701_24345 [Actinoalloteichus sp. AHMU CJ021]